MSEKPLRASEIAEYVYCRRAWWLHRSGVRSENVRPLVAGSDYHQTHGKLVRKAHRARLAVYVLFVLAAAAVLIALMQVI